MGCWSSLGAISGESSPSSDSDEEEEGVQHRRNKLHFRRMDRRESWNWMLFWTGRNRRCAEGGQSRGGVGGIFGPRATDPGYLLGRRGMARAEASSMTRKGPEGRRLTAMANASTGSAVAASRRRASSASSLDAGVCAPSPMFPLPIALFGTFFDQQKLALSLLSPLLCNAIQVALATFYSLARPEAGGGSSNP